MEIAKRISEENPGSISLFRCETQGANYARNIAFTKAGGEFIQWLDADDELAPDKILKQVCALQNEASYEIATCDGTLRVFKEGRIENELLIPTEQTDNYLLHLLRHYWLPPNCYLLRRHIAQELHDLGAWNTDTSCLQDAEYFLCAAALGHCFLYVKETSAIYNQWGDTQISQLRTEHSRADARRHIYGRIKEIYGKHSTSIDEETLFLLSTSSGTWHVNEISNQSLPALKTNTETAPEELNAFEQKILSSLTIINSAGQLQDAVTLESIAESILFHLSFMRWCLESGVPAQPNAINDFLASCSALPTRPQTNQGDIWFKIMKILEHFIALDLIQPN